MSDKSNMKLKETYSGAPNTERGRSASFDINVEGDTMIYGCDSNIIIKNLKNPLDVDIYTEHKKRVTCVKFSPNGYYVCSGDEGGNVYVWSFDNEDRTRQLTIQPLSSAVRDISWTFDSQRIVIVGFGKRTFTHVFIWNTGTSIGSIDGHSKTVLSCDFRPSRPFKVVTGSEDATSNFYRGPPFKFEVSNRSHTNYVNCVRYAPDSSKYVSCSSDKKMILYDGKSGKEMGEFPLKHKGSIYQAAWSKDSKQILSSSADKTVRVWDADNLKYVQSITFEDKSIDYMQVGVVWDKVSGNAWSLSLNGTLNVLDFKTKKPSMSWAGHNAMIEKIAYDGKKYFYSCGSEGKLIQWELGKATSRVVQGKKGFHKHSIATLLPIGNFLVIGSEDSVVRFVPADTFKYQGKSDDIKLSGVPCDIQFDGKNLLFVCTHKGISVIDSSSQSLKFEFSITDYEPTSISYNSSTKELAVGGDDKQVRIYKLQPTKLSESLVIKGHRGPIKVLRYSPDGSLLAVGDSFREIIVYDSSSYKQKYVDLLFHTGGVTDLDWSPDSKLLLSSSLDKKLIVWDLANKKHWDHQAHYQGVRSCVFVDSKTFLSAGAGYNIKRWTFTPQSK